MILQRQPLEILVPSDVEQGNHARALRPASGRAGGLPVGTPGPEITLLPRPVSPSRAVNLASEIRPHQSQGRNRAEHRQET